MANNTDFLKVMIRDVKFLWPRLDQPYRYNNVEKRTEPCPATATNAGYSITWEAPTDAGRALYNELRGHYEKCRAGNAKLPEFGTVFGMKRDDENGVVIFTARKRAVSQAGTANKPPKVVDAALKPMTGEDAQFWSGSRGDLRVLAFPTTDPDGVGGISLLLDVVQVKEAVYGGDNIEDDFEVAEPQAHDISSIETEDPATPQPAATASAPADAPW